jgi:Tol biopolymer transport system component
MPTPSPSLKSTASLRQLTQGGCCVQPFFSPDGQQVLFIDKPGAEAATGMYAVEISNPQTPLLQETVIGFRSADRTIVAVMDGDLARFTNEATGETWTINTGGNWPRFAPDNRQVLWVATDREGPYDRRQSDVWLANLDGSEARRRFTVFGGGFTGWLPDSQRAAFIGRDNPNEEKQTLFVYDFQNERRTNLFSHKRLRGGEISPNGSWISFFITFSDEAADNGLWLVSTASQIQRQLELPRFGGYRWQDDDTLLFIPLRLPEEPGMQLWTIAAATGQFQPLTNPESLVFSISNGDWEVSPDGRHVVFVNSTDQNIWLLTLP